MHLDNNIGMHRRPFVGRHLVDLLACYILAILASQLVLQMSSSNRAVTLIEMSKGFVLLCLPHRGNRTLNEDDDDE